MNYSQNESNWCAAYIDAFLSPEGGITFPVYKYGMITRGVIEVYADDIMISIMEKKIDDKYMTKNTRISQVKFCIGCYDGKRIDQLRKLECVSWRIDRDKYAGFFNFSPYYRVFTCFDREQCLDMDYASWKRFKDSYLSQLDSKGEKMLI